MMITIFPLLPKWCDPYASCLVLSTCYRFPDKNMCFEFHSFEQTNGRFSTSVMSNAVRLTWMEVEECDILL